MQTTIRLPDELYGDVKRTALEAGTTVTAFIEDAIRAALLRRQDAAVADRAPYRVRTYGAGGLQPGVDMTDSAALLDLMDRN